MSLEGALALLNGSAVTAQDLADIAVAYPALRPQVASHPLAYPELLTWLSMLREPAVDAALAARADRGAAPQLQAQAQTNHPLPDRRRSRRRSIVVGLSAAIVLGIAITGMIVVPQILNRNEAPPAGGTTDVDAQSADSGSSGGETVPRLLDIAAPAERSWVYDASVDPYDDPDVMGDEGYWGIDVVSDDKALVYAYATEASFAADYRSWQISLLDLTNGQTTWTRALGDLVNEGFFADVSGDRLEIVLHTELDNSVAVLTLSSGDDSTSLRVGSQVVAIDLSSGRTVSTTLLDGVVGDEYRSALVGDAFLTTLFSGESFDVPQSVTTRAFALPVADVDGHALWEADVDATTRDVGWTRLSSTRATLLQRSEDGEFASTVHDVASGATVPFAEAAMYGSMGGWYFASDDADVGNLMYGFKDGGEISRLDDDGRLLWTASSTDLKGVDDALFAAPGCVRDDSNDRMCDGWRRVDPATGEDVWADPLEPGLRPLGTIHDRLLVGRSQWSGTPHNTWDYTEFLWVDLETGVVLRDVPAPRADAYYYSVSFAEAMLYILYEGHVDAYEVGQSTPLWSLPVDSGESGSEYVWYQGAHLVISAQGMLTGIGTAQP